MFVGRANMDVAGVGRLHPILDEIYSGKEMNYSMFRMKLDISGYIPDLKFFRDFVYIVLLGVKGEKLFLECIRNGMFVDFFRDWKTFNWILDMFSSKNNLGLAVKKIISALCGRKPGILIGHFLKHGRVSVGRIGEPSTFFEDMALYYSNILSKMNDDYRVKIHPKIMEIIQDNRNFVAMTN